MSASVSRLRVRRFSRPELSELARWEATSCRHGWSVGDGEMSPVEVAEDGVEYVSLYLAAVSGGPVYFLKPGPGSWAVVDGRGNARRYATLRAALEFVCPTLAQRELSADRSSGAVVVRLPPSASHLTLLR
jgi:hypothetical protein